MTLIKKDLRNITTTIHCKQRYVIVKISSCVLINVDLPCSGTTDRSTLYDSLLVTARRVCIARTMSWQDVGLSVCLSHAGIVPKRLHIFSKFLHRRVAPPF